MANGRTEPWTKDLSLFDLGLLGYPCLTMQTSGHKKELASQSRIARAPEKVRGVSTSVADISGIGASAIHPTCSVWFE